MPRPARYTDDDVLDAALTCVANLGPRVSIAEIADELSGPVGSIYHRFASREVLMVRLWLRSVQRFQAGLFELAKDPDPHEAIVAMALHIPRYCRAHPHEAISLTLYRQERLLIECPAEVRGAVSTLNDALVRLAGELTTSRYGRLDEDNRHWVLKATRVAPYGLSRPYLGGPIPSQVDEATAAVADAILRLGDPPPQRAAPNLSPPDSGA
ncbi:MAG: TetR/AcrR family transcriptional regulator [Ornithinimicrobium sp.]